MMGRIYSGVFQVALGTDSSQDLCVLSPSSTTKAVIHEFQLTSDATTAAILQISLIERGSAGSGGTSVTERALDPDNDTAATVVVTQGVTTPGSSSGSRAAWFWEQLGPLIYQPLPEDRITMDTSSDWGIALQTTPASETVNGYIVWEEL